MTRGQISQEGKPKGADDARLERLADLVAERLAPRLAYLLDGTPNRGDDRLVDAGAVADALGVSRSYVYDHAAELGAQRLGDPGDGRRPRLRFRLDHALAAHHRPDQCESTLASTAYPAAGSILRSCRKPEPAASP